MEILFREYKIDKFTVRNFGILIFEYYRVSCQLFYHWRIDFSKACKYNTFYSFARNVGGNASNGGGGGGGGGGSFV